MSASAVAIPIAIPCATSALADSFPDHCQGQAPLPFYKIKVAHPIDATCGIKGKLTSSAASQLQNSVKNDFCVCPSSGRPETYTSAMLVVLQKNTKIRSGQGLEPTDRKPLRDLGEGKLIRMKAYLFEAHHADLSSEESVNRNGASEDANDVHIAFVANPDDKECTSVTAEISPHYRPASWNEIGNFEIYNASSKNYVVNPQNQSRLQAHPYRITGQLFFDASHAPCPCEVHCSPVRVPVWEIHPVYSAEVCPAGSACNEDSDAHWLSFDDFWNSLSPVQPIAKPHSHATKEPAAQKPQHKKRGTSRAPARP
jgi:hypothetical protein